MSTAKPTPMAIGALNKLVIEIPGIDFLYQIDIDSPSAKNDELILEHNESDWKEIIKVSNLIEIDTDWVKLFFTNPPKEGTFNLIQDPKDDEDPFYVFWEVAYEDLSNLTAEAQDMREFEETEASEDDQSEEDEEPNLISVFDV